MAIAFQSGLQEVKGGFRADLLQLQFAGPTQGMLVQNVQFSITQQITFLFEIGTTDVYYVGGRAQGTASIARIIGPGANQSDLINDYGNLCEPAPIDFIASGACPSAGGISYTLVGAVLTTIANSVNANDIMINEQLQFIFSDLVVV